MRKGGDAPKGKVNHKSLRPKAKRNGAGRRESSFLDINVSNLSTAGRQLEVQLLLDDLQPTVAALLLSFSRTINCNY